MFDIIINPKGPIVYYVPGVGGGGGRRLQNSKKKFFSKSVKKSVKRGVRVLRALSARASHAQSRSLFSASFQTSRVLEYAKLRTVLQSRGRGFSEKCGV